MEPKKDVSRRRKRQVDRGARRWTNNRLFYFFDNSDALTFVRDRTCLDFTESSTATNRVRVFSGAGCFATIGMAGGEQSLSLGSGCESVGIAAHEFAHALGVWHTQMRDDRDSFLRVDLSSVPPNLLHNYIKLPASRIINYTPYEYGSYMHYDSRSIISFYDIKMLNDHYGCNARCTDRATVCFNGGVPNPRNCAVCNCPAGYSGALCNQRPPGCGEMLTATDRWQAKRFTFGSATGGVRDTFIECNHWITAPAGKRVQIQVTSLQNSQCQRLVELNSIEPKILADRGITNPRICCPDSLNQILTSQHKTHTRSSPNTRLSRPRFFFNTVYRMVTKCFPYK
ncbi:astacin [Ostertagia ostertagi]